MHAMELYKGDDYVIWSGTFNFRCRL